MIEFKFLSTLSLRRATHGHCAFGHAVDISIHALLAESDRFEPGYSKCSIEFLSTLSLRRATWPGTGNCWLVPHFYPRSPCGERRHCAGHFSATRVISIHALLAESDNPVCIVVAIVKYFYPRSPCGERLRHCTTYLNCSLFLSTLSLRRATAADISTRREARISIHALLAESDSITIITICIAWKFLSTLSLRRATTILNHPQHAN